jgi:hypothetical protein
VQALQGTPGSRRVSVVDADFVHFAGLRELDMAGNLAFTDAAFVHLRGICKLRLRRCSCPCAQELKCGIGDAM